MVIYINGSNETIRIQEKEDENFELIVPNIFLVEDDNNPQDNKEFVDINKAIKYGEELQSLRELEKWLNYFQRII